MRPHRLAIVGIVVTVLAGSASSALAQDATLTASGTATATPRPANRHDESSIRDAVEKAEAAALPRAVADARGHARELARAAGLKLGDLVTVTDAPSPGYGPFAFYGPFGAGRFCNRQPRFKTVVDGSGRRRRVRAKGTHVVCRVPPTVAVSVSLTFKVKR